MTDENLIVRLRAEVGERQGEREARIVLSGLLHEAATEIEQLMAELDAAGKWLDWLDKLGPKVEELMAERDTARHEALEEAARVVEAQAEREENSHTSLLSNDADIAARCGYAGACARQLAAAIRALKTSHDL
jgi:hypothetical protein